MATRPDRSYYERVYELVRQVPPGRVVTYGQLALELGSPSAARAAGYALYNLQAGNDVPWWRVINASGAISYKGRGPQADLQRELLEREGVRFDAEGRTRLGEYRWWFDSEQVGPGG
ncbi:MAG: MGMT family protein [Tepidiformaceae bacterium]